MRSSSAKEIHETRMTLWEKSIESHKKLLDRKTGLISNAYTRSRNCPSCNRDAFTSMFSKEGGSYVKCNFCGMVYLNPVLKDEVLSEHYENNHSEQAATVDADENFYSDIYRKGLNLMRGYTKDPRSLLDVGCSAGYFLGIAKQEGWRDCAGVELNKTEAQIARSRGYTVYTERHQQVAFEHKFNAITLWDVFEHIVDGVEFIETLKPLLSERGIIFMQIPNSSSLAARVMWERCNMFDGLEHVNLYNPATLREVAKRSGCAVLEMRSVISELSVLNNYANYEQPYTGSMPESKKFLEIIEEEALLGALLGYKLQVLLRPE